MKYPFLLFACCSILFGETVVSGIIEGQERWTLEGSPYVVTNDIHIKSSGRLVIEPGVEVLVELPQKVPADIVQENGVDSFGVTIKVEGALVSEGKIHNPIVFKGRYLRDKYTHWCGIELNSRRSDEILVSFTKISDATTGISVKKGMPLIRNCILEYNNIGISTSGISTPRIVQSVFSGNFLAAVRIKESNPELYNNIIVSNRNVGVWADRVSEFTFEHNLVFGNGDRNYVDCPLGLGAILGTNRNGDSVDVYQNLTMDPMFEGSPAVVKRLQKDAQKRAELQLKDTTFLDDTLSLFAKESERYRLSSYSPAINAGKSMGVSTNKFEEIDGSHADLGIYGGPEFIEF